ncbi:MAG TPA: hypothetical protein VGM29_17345 [Polyangiaceae bacterium]|jgi:hypothetical protein
MPPSTPTELKKFLLAEGFEVYRMLGDQVVLADRVRDNLIMDSWVTARPGPACDVRFVIRAQARDFPGETEQQLFARARSLAEAARERGYAEVAAKRVEVPDPGDGSQTLDVWYQVTFEKSVAAEPELAGELRYALSLEKTVPVDSQR